MLVELTNNYIKDCYSYSESICDKHYIEKEDIIRVSCERGIDIESYYTNRYKQNYYVYINGNSKTERIQIDEDSFNKLIKILESED